jgi:hypothetical protein
MSSHDGELRDSFEPDNCKLPSDKEFFDAMKSFSLNLLKVNPLLSMYAWLSYTNADHFVRQLRCPFSFGTFRLNDIFREKMQSRRIASVMQWL